jgi:hypothetical protein
MPPWSIVTISLFESGGPSGMFAEGAVVFVRGGTFAGVGRAAATVGR